MRGFRLGKVAGFEISIDWSWLIVLFLVIYSLAAYYFPHNYPGIEPSIAWAISVIAALCLFASVLAHELMHSLVARRYGIEIQGITLFIFGGVSQTKGEPDTPKSEFWMAIAGPLMSVAIGLAFYFLTYVGRAALWSPLVIAVTGYVGWINLILAAFNLVPGFPLDGGRILRAAIWSVTNNLEEATRYASYSGQGFGYLLMGYGVFTMLVGGLIGGIWLIFIGWFLAGNARSSYEQVVLKQALSGVEVEKVMTEDVPTVPEDITVDTFVHDYLMKEQYPCYPVVEDEQVKGVVSIDEVRSLPREMWQSTKVGDITEPVDDHYLVNKSDDAWDALVRLASEDARRLLVMHDGILDGTVTQENILRLVRMKMQLGM